jgi:hypothetical protein
VKSYKTNGQGLKVLLVDERSLVGATTLGWVEFMCRYGVEEGQNFDKTWGGLPVVIFFCDNVQFLTFFISRNLKKTAMLNQKLYLHYSL